ncbi:MAG: tol-pal system-associated acyl-CoA thioesterase [Candidatus Thiodiazotropha sp.]
MNDESPSFVWPVRVYYEDTDSGGVVYHANYLNFMERARTEWLRSLGFEQDRLLQQDGIIFAVRHVEVSYDLPARFNDALEVHVRLAKIGRASLTIYQEVIRASDAQLLCWGNVKVVCVNMNKMSPTPIPKKILMEIPDVD